MSRLRQLALVLAAFSLVGSPARSEPFLSEVLFEPPGPDIPNQYIELRGTPNFRMPQGFYLVSVDGDAKADPGTIENVFDLSGAAIGGNGFLLLLQKSNTYVVSSNAALLVNSGAGEGFGSGAGSSIRHQGRSSRTDLPHASVTFFLVQATNPPAPGTDIDDNNNGTPGGQTYRGWTVLDSVGVAVNSGDIAYGAINFRKASDALASGTVVPVAFTPWYVGRSGNTAGSDPGAWVAGGSLEGLVPPWNLSTNKTEPAPFGGRALNHLGLPNFGAPALPGLVALQPGGRTELLEGGDANYYLLGLNTMPGGPVVVRLTAPEQIQISVDGGIHFSSSASLTLTNNAMATVQVHALVDNVIECSPHPATIRHDVISTGDPAQYPIATLGPEVIVNVFEQEFLLLNEIKVNPPGTNNAPCQFVELRGPPNAQLRNVQFLAIDSDPSRDPGRVRLAKDLSGTSLGSSGLLVLTATGSPYTLPPTATVVTDPRLDQAGGAFDDGAMSMLLITSPTAVSDGVDLDAGDNGTLGGLPAGTTVLDAVGWQSAGGSGVVYGGVTLSGIGGAPDAVARFSTNATPFDGNAWYYGELAGTDCSSLVFDSTRVSSNFPGGVILSPGLENRFDVQVVPPGPFSGVIGDATNPGIDFQVGADGVDPDAVETTASSSNPDVVPDGNLVVVPGPNGVRTLFLNPVGVGYSTITLTARAGGRVGQIAFPYAASAMGRPGGAWHTFASDASAANAIDPDWMLVADNENNTVRLYERHRSGAPARLYDFHQDLGLTPQERGEVNIEGSTRSGNRLYFIGAHSNSNLGVSRTNRHRVFGADLSGAGTNVQLSFVGRYDYLKDDLIAWDSANGHGKGTNYYGFAASAVPGVNPKAPDGFNIEGLTMAPGSTTTAWIGFRAPLVPVSSRTFALIVPVLNFASLALSGGPPGSAVFGAPIELDLYGRGIRSIEGRADTGFLMVAGPPGDVGGYPNDFRLYTWSGNPADQPQQRAADLTGVMPEGIVELPQPPWSPQTEVQLVTDNGTTVLYKDGIQDKHLLTAAFKKFRSDWVTIGPVVKPVPIITGVALGSNAVTLTWRALRNETYRVQFGASLGTPTWEDVSANIVATGPFVTTSVQRTSPTQGFYRVMLINTP